MTTAEVQALRMSAESRDILDRPAGRVRGPQTWLIVDLALATGLRVSELAAIRVEDIDLDRQIIRVTRRKKRRPAAETLGITALLALHLRGYLAWRSHCGHAPTGPLVVGKRGGLAPGGWAKAWRQAVKQAGLPAYSIHVARHTLGTHLWRKTHDLRLVQAQLGHSSPATTANMYTYVSDEDLRAGVEGVYD
jgi:integrase